MGFLDQLDVPDRRTDRRICDGCEATPGACRGRHYVSGRYCCPACVGNHDQEPPR